MLNETEMFMSRTRCVKASEGCVLCDLIKVLTYCEPASPVLEVSTVYVLGDIQQYYTKTSTSSMPKLTKSDSFDQIPPFNFRNEPRDIGQTQRFNYL